SFSFFFQAEDGIRDSSVTGVQTCALPILLIPFLNEACFALQESLGSVDDIDNGVKLGLNHPMGPFELADLIGLDTCLAISEVLRSEEHTSELQSHLNLVCRLLLEKKKVNV